MTEREELIKEWTNHDMRLPAIKLAEGGYLDRALAIAFESGHAAGRRSRQKQDAELCDAAGCPECCKDIEGTP